MKFSISGADQDTGDSIEMTVEAADESAAREVAHRKGIIVSHVASPMIQSLAATGGMRAAPISQTLEQGHYRAAPVVNVATPRRGNSLGIVSLVLGTLAFMICWIPLVNLLGVPLAALGLLLGLVGMLVALTRKGASIGFPIAGIAVCCLAGFVAISITGAFAGGLKKAADSMLAESKRRNATNQTEVSPTVVNAPVKASAPPTPAVTSPVTPEATATPLTSPADGGSPAAAPPEQEWASASSPVRQGDIQIRVTGVTVGQVPLKSLMGSGESKSKDVLLSIRIEITNLSDTKKLEYRTWGGSGTSFGSRTRLTDNFDNRYRVIDFGFSSNIVGAVRSESVYPGKALADVLVFEEPIAKAEHLNLELPAEQFGGTGVLRIRIPASMIER